MIARSPSKLPCVLVLAGAAVVVASTFLPWREAMPPLVVSLSPSAWTLTFLAVVFGGIVGLAILVRGSNPLAAVVGILVDIFLSLIIVMDYGIAKNVYTSRDPEIIEALYNVVRAGADLHVMAGAGPGFYLSAIGVIAMIIGSLIGLVKRRVAAAPTPAKPEPGLPAWVPNLVGGRGHYLNSRVELAGGLVDLMSAHHDVLDFVFAPR